ncbi:MAG: hypothetical protein ABI844_08570 [Saprospiraceae bacterium]
MASRPYKTTGCFRFAIFLLIFAPLAYLGAAYYNGQDGVGNIKNMFNKVVNVFSSNKANDTQTVSIPVESNKSTNTANPALSIEIADLKSAVERKDKEINTLINENLDLKLKLKECEVKNTPAK